MNFRRVATLVLAALVLTVLYADVVTGLVRAWQTNDDYSHGFVVLPFCAYFVWERRRRLAVLDLQPSAIGLAVVLMSLLVFAAGELGAELFLARVSLIGVLAGSVIFVLGWRHVRTLALPLCFAVLMIPLPAIVFNAIAFPLQLMASSAAEHTLAALNVPVLREGNVILLATVTLEVAEACSGIRSLVSLLTLGVVYGYFTEEKMSRRVILAAATIPIAIAANAIRVAGTGVLAHVAGPAVADGFFHTFAGWMVFMVAVAMLFLLQHLLRLAGSGPAPTPLVSEVTL